MQRGPDGVLASDAPKLSVWFDAMPESNGKANWTAILHRGDLASGHTIDRSEHHDRVRYAADRVRWLIGELADEPDILAYDEHMLNPEGWTHSCGVTASSDTSDLDCWEARDAGGTGPICEPCNTGNRAGCLYKRKAAAGVQPSDGGQG